MPSVVLPKLRAPVIVRAAIEAFGSELRVQLIHHFLRQKGTQAEAARALEVAPRSISFNTHALLAAGVLIEHPGPNKRARSYVVDEDRLRDLRQALSDYLTPPSESSSE